MFVCRANHLGPHTKPERRTQSPTIFLALQSPDSNIPCLGANLLDGNSLFALHNLIHPHPTSNRVLARLVGGTELGKGKR